MEMAFGRKSLLKVLVTLTTLVSIPNLLASIPPYFNINKSQTCYPSYPIQYPRSLSDITSIVQTAIDKGLHLKAFGSRHSFTDSFCTDGIPIDMKKINHVAFNKENHTVRVGAGVEFKVLLDILRQYNRTLQSLPEFNGITVGGAVAMGTHDSSLLRPVTTSDIVVSMIVVDGTVKVRTINNREDLNAFRINLGLLGVVYEIELETIPIFKVRLYNYQMSDNILFQDDEILKIAKRHYFFQFAWFPTTSNMVITQGDIVFNDTPGNAKFKLIPYINPKLSVAFSRFAEFAIETKNLALLSVMQISVQQFLYRKIPLVQPIYSEDGKTLSNPAVGYANELLSSGCSPCDWSGITVTPTAIALDLAEFPSAVRTMRAMLKSSSVAFLMYGFLFRFSPSGDGLMMIHNGRPTVIVEWASVVRFHPKESPRLGIATLQAINQALISKHGGRPHWAKSGSHYYSKEIIDAGYGTNIKLFTQFASKYDPNGLFLNDYGRRILGIRNPHSEKLEKFCALQDDCICKKDEDCGPPSQIKCNNLHGYSVCDNQRR